MTKEEFKYLLDLLGGYEHKRITLTKEPYALTQSAGPRQEMYMKPSKGIWFSYGSGWVDWILDNMDKWCKRYNYVYELDVQDTLLMLYSVEDILQFDQDYGITRTIPAIDWAKVAQAYDGLDIPTYHWKARLDTRCMWYYGWDVSGGVVWKPSAVKGVKLLYTAQKQVAI